MMCRIRRRGAGGWGDDVPAADHTGCPVRGIETAEGAGWRESAAAAEQPNLIGIRLSRNFGKEAALCAGLEAARGEATIVMDGDLQHPPSLIPEMVARWRATG